MAGKKEQVAGKVMEQEGKATGDPIRETEGKALSRYGKLKGRLAQARGAGRGVVDGAARS